MRRFRLLILLACAGGAAFWLLAPRFASRLSSGGPLIPSAASTVRTAPFSSQDPNPPQSVGTPAVASTPGGSSRLGPTPPPLPRAAAGQPALAARAPLPGPPVSPLSRELADPALAPASAPKVVLKMFDAYRSRFGGYPTGSDNREFVNALVGNNPKGLPILDRSHSRLNEKGELLDGWGTPYFFHLIDRNFIEVRSAGPDRVMYTADDVVAAPPR